MTTIQQPPAVSWHAQWECGACGQGGDEPAGDGTVLDAGHDCDEDDGPDVCWEARAECATCGWSLESQYEEGDWIEARHHGTTDR
ncbi:hypothetical protein [Kitasatospora sp. NPDC097691]|uniref:hypothetical protein n=1 Tax=Kitasatospora sp. NPDC097691 TaxID=3157231 RepID=UPI0033248471